MCVAVNIRSPPCASSYGGQGFTFSGGRLSAAPPTPPDIRVTYHGGSTELSRCRNMELGETK